MLNLEFLNGLLELTQGEANPSELSRAFKAAKNELAEVKGELTKAQTELEGLRKAASEGASKEQVDQYDQRIRVRLIGMCTRRLTWSRSRQRN